MSKSIKINIIHKYKFLLIITFLLTDIILYFINELSSNTIYKAMLKVID